MVDFGNSRGEQFYSTPFLEIIANSGV